MLNRINTPLFLSLLGAFALTQQITASRDPAESRQVRPHGMWQNREFRRSILEYLCAKDLFTSLIHTSKALGQSVADVQMKEGKDYIEWLDKMYKRGAPNRVIAMEVAAALTRCPWATIGNGCTIKVSMAAMFHNNTFHFDACRAYELSSWKYANTPILRDDLRDKWVRKFVIDLMAEKMRSLSESDIQELEQAKKIRSDILPEVEPVLESLRPPAAAHLMHSLLYSGCSCDPLMVPPSSNIIKQLLARTVDCEVLNEFMPFVRSAFRLTDLFGRRLQADSKRHRSLIYDLCQYFEALKPAKSLHELRTLIAAEDQFIASSSDLKTLLMYLKFFETGIIRYEKMAEQILENKPGQHEAMPRDGAVLRKLITARIQQLKLLMSRTKCLTTDYIYMLIRPAASTGMQSAEWLMRYALDPENKAERQFLVPFILNLLECVKKYGYQPLLVYYDDRQEAEEQIARIDQLVTDFLAALRGEPVGSKPTIELEETELKP